MKVCWPNYAGQEYSKIRFGKSELGLTTWVLEDIGLGFGEEIGSLMEK